MGERLTLPEIVARISAKKSLDKTKVEQFMSALFETIQEQLLSRRIAKVRGVGVFKLEWFAPRIIANVNTGEESRIGGHYRIVFTPEREVAALINSNFAHLQTIVLSNDGDDWEATPPDEVPAKEHSPAIVPSHRAPINDILSELVEAQSIIREIERMDEPQEESALEEKAETVAEKMIETEEFPVVEEVVEDEFFIDQVPEVDVDDAVLNEIALGEQPADWEEKPLVATLKDEEVAVDNSVDDEILPKETTVDDGADAIEEQELERGGAEESHPDSIIVEPINNIPVRDEENKKGADVPQAQSPAKGKTSWPMVITIVTIMAVLGIFGYIYLEYYGITQQLRPETTVEESKPSYFDRAISWVKGLMSSEESEALSGMEPLPIGSETTEDQSKGTLPSTGTVGQAEPAVPTVSEQNQKTTEGKRAHSPRERVPGVYDKLLYGETLQSLAVKHYERAEFWCYIYEANKSKIGNIFQIKSGTVLFIPERGRYNINPNDSISVKLATKKSDEIMKLMLAK